MDENWFGSQAKIDNLAQLNSVMIVEIYLRKPELLF